IMKKIFSSFLVVAMMLAAMGMVSNSANAATADDTINVNMDVLSTITMACTDTVTMGAITGTGTSALGTNLATCNVKTNNTAGYKLDWETGTVSMTNATADTIAGLAAGTTAVPATWAVDAAASGWGARLSTASTDDDAKWSGADDYTGAWAAVPAAAETVVSRATETAQAGSDEIIVFGAEVGSNKWQPTGTYSTSVTMTATTL
ncbi:MAG: hypothetical protein Q8M12_00530, partial [bacterium]|nr:hypothetical protein [bacterium]